jgi:hypothetical protein
VWGPPVSGYAAIRPALIGRAGWYPLSPCVGAKSRPQQRYPRASVRATPSPKQPEVIVVQMRRLRVGKAAVPLHFPMSPTAALRSAAHLCSPRGSLWAAMPCGLVRSRAARPCASGPPTHCANGSLWSCATGLHADSAHWLCFIFFQFSEYIQILAKFKNCIGFI